MVMPTLKIPVTTGDHIRGNIHAPYTLVEYGNYECSYCALAHPVVQQVQAYFGDQLRLVYRNFPLREAHPHAEIAAETAEFAAEYGKFWEMHDLILMDNENLSKSWLLALSTQLELPITNLQEAWVEKRYQAKIRADFQGGVISGVNGTPTFFIKGYRYNRPPTVDELIKAIELAYE
jgi:protein-disulfide isomerase